VAYLALSLAARPQLAYFVGTVIKIHQRLISNETTVLGLMYSKKANQANTDFNDLETRPSAGFCLSVECPVLAEDISFDSDQQWLPTDSGPRGREFQ